MTTVLGLWGRFGISFLGDFKGEGRDNPLKLERLLSLALTPLNPLTLIPLSSLFPPLPVKDAC